MAEPRAQRTLVKSPPELWAEISDVSTLARHLGEFGEIRITRLEPETTVAWEGDRARGTVELAPSGWGTRVTLTAEALEAEAAAEAIEEPEPEPVAVAEPAPEPEPEPVAGAEPEPEPKPVAVAEPESEPEPVAGAEAGPEPAIAEPEPGVRWWQRLFRRQKSGAVGPEPVAEVIVEPEPGIEPVAEAPVVEETPEPIAVAEPQPEAVAEEPAPEPLDAERMEAVLVGVLDDLGAAHHRPFSRG